MLGKMLSRGGQVRRLLSARPSVAGNGLVERMRSTTFALLGVTAAIGLALVALASQQGWPYLPASPIPGPPGTRESVGDGAAVAPASRVPVGAAGRAVARPKASEAIPGLAAAGPPGPRLAGSRQLTAPSAAGGQPSGGSAPAPVGEPSGEGPPPASPAPAPTGPSPAPPPTPAAPPVATSPAPPASASTGHGKGNAYGHDEPSPDRGEGPHPAPPHRPVPPAVPESSGEPSAGAPAAPGEPGQGPGRGHAYGHDGGV
jgi:translation initiation factor IF-2